MAVGKGDFSRVEPPSDFSFFFTGDEPPFDTFLTLRAKKNKKKLACELVL
jgi:hypothetical protein